MHYIHLQPLKCEDLLLLPISLCASAHCSHTLDTVYRSVTNKALIHHYTRAGWPCLTIRRLILWYSFINQSHVCTQKSDCRYSHRSQDVVLLSVPSAWTELGKKSFKLSAPLNNLQNYLKLRDLVSLPDFKALISTMVNEWVGTCLCL